METSQKTIEQKKQIKVLYIATLVLLLPLFASLYYLYDKSKEPEVAALPVEEVKPISVNLQKVNTTAHAAFVVSLNNENVLYAKNPDKQLPLASITKLVTAKVAEDQSMSDTVAVHKMPDPTYGDAQLAEGERWEKNDLIAYTLVTSSNDGAYSLSTGTKSQTAFVDSMNSLASTIGLTNTRFYNETGLDNELQDVPGSRGTAKDISKLLSYLVKTDLSLYEKTKYNTAVVESPTGLTQARNTNEVANQITGLLVSKTGYTDLAGGNLAIVADMGLNEPTAFVVLHSSKESRFEDILSLQEEYFAQVAAGMR
jgi:serine-type D-Ala-D-Ala endopeptidase (penicillin-binding protein 7)